jgi:DNA-binding CsgD family transcriptional regulator
LYAAALAQPLEPAARAEMLLSRAQALFAMDRTPEAEAAAREAAAIREGLGNPGALAEALATLGPIEWAEYRPGDAIATAMRAVHLLERDGDSPRRAFALAYAGLLLVAVDRYPESLPFGDAAVSMSRRLGAPALEALGLALRGGSRLLLGDDDGLAEMERAVDAAAGVAHHANVMIAYVLMVQTLWALGRFPEAERVTDEGLAYARERDLALYVDHLRAHRLRLRALRGEWDAAADGLAALIAGATENGATRYSLPALAQLLVRRGDDAAPEVLDRAFALAVRADSLLALVPAAAAVIEQAWLTGRPAAAQRAVALLPERFAVPGGERGRAELLRLLRRLGEPVEPFPGCPEEYAAGLRGDWAAAAAAWDRIGDPYARALELADSGEVEPTREALRVLDELGARPAAALVRRRLREMGVSVVPRGPQPATRANPAGLTGRQTEILRLLARGLTNAEIAARLVVSVRTVDHHVSAVLQKLGVTTRRDAVAAAARLGLDEPGA